MLLAARIRNAAPSVSLHFKRWTSSSSPLPPEILAAAQQKLKAEAGLLRHLKIEIPNTEHDRRLLLDLKADVPGLWNFHEITAQSGITKKRMYFMFDSHENAARALAKIRELNQSTQRSWKAQLYPATTSLSFVEPSTGLAIRLGTRGTLKDAIHLFRGYETAPEGMPIDTCLSDGKNMSLVRFRTPEHAIAARSWLINEGKTLCEGYPSFTEADIGFVSLPLEDVTFYHERSEPKRELFISGLGCRIDVKTLKKLLGPFDGVTGVKISQDWLGANSGRALVLFKTVQQAKKARDALNGAYFSGSGRRLIVKYEMRKDTPNSVGRVPSTLKVQSLVDGSPNYLTHLAKIIRRAPGLFHVWDAKGADGQSVAYLEFDNADNARKALAAFNASCQSGPPGKHPLSTIIDKPRYSYSQAIRSNSAPCSSMSATLGARESLSDVVHAYQGFSPLQIWLKDGDDFAFILFGSVEDAVAAFRARNGQPLREGGPVSWIRFALPRVYMDPLRYSRSPNNELHVVGLGCRATKEEFHEFCRQTDGLVGTRLKSHWTGRSMGYGAAVYRSTADAGTALKELHGAVYPHSGAKLEVDYAFATPADNVYDGVYSL